MQADRGVTESGIFPGELNDLPTGFKVDPNVDDSNKPRIFRSRDHFLAIFIKTVKVQMSVAVDCRNLQRSSSLPESTLESGALELITLPSIQHACTEP